MKVNLKFINNDAKNLYSKANNGITKGVAEPFKTHIDDFCYDCIAVSCEEIAPNVYSYGLGIALQIDNSFLLNNGVIWSIDCRPRSSVWKTGMILSNCEGTIDMGYTGEIKAVFYHVMPNMPKYEIGDKICQIKIGMTTPILFNIVEELGETSRGNGGYGSTGK